VLMGPTAETPQGFQLAVDAGRLQAALFAQMLTVTDQVHCGERLHWIGRVPAKKSTEIAVVGPHRGERQVFSGQRPAKLVQERPSPELRDAGCISRKVIPRVSTPVCCVKYGHYPTNLARNPISTPEFHAGLENLAASGPKFTLRKPKTRSSE